MVKTIKTELPASELEMVGFSIDRSCTPNVAYKGSREAPEVSVILLGTVADVPENLEICIRPDEIEFLEECPWDQVSGDHF